ncbi:MAG: FtsX-like permease family protein [Desulfobacterales bacterium]
MAIQTNRYFDLLPVRAFLFALIWVFFAPFSAGAENLDLIQEQFVSDIKTLSNFDDRSIGSEGFNSAGEFIRQTFADLNLGEVGTHLFLVPTLLQTSSTLTLLPSGQTFAVEPLRGNAITPQTIEPPGLEAPLIYAGNGELSELSGKNIKGSIVFMELNSGNNWLNAASLGAKALIYIDRGELTKSFFEDKMELSPIHFPRFRMAWDKVQAVFPDLENDSGQAAVQKVRLVSDTRWENVTAKNIYCLVNGSDPELKEELVIVEAFYDSTAHVIGNSPGADEAVGIASLISYARGLRENPPARSVMLVATSGHAQSLAGMREMIWSIRARTRFQRDMQSDLKKTIRRHRKMIDVLEKVVIQESALHFQTMEKVEKLFKEAIADRIKTDVDRIARRLMRLRLEKKDIADEKDIQKLADRRFLLRQMGWRNDFQNLSKDELEELTHLIPGAIEDHKVVLKDAEIQNKMIQSSRDFRSVAKRRDVAAVISLHLSSHGDGIGAFNKGWLFPLRPRINRVSAYAVVNDVIDQWAVNSEYNALYNDTLRPSRLRKWESYLPDQPQLGGEVSAIAGYHGITLATVNDIRPMWGTPYDTAGKVDFGYAVRQSRMVADLMDTLCRAPRLHNGEYPRDGFSTLTGRAKFLRHGELFPDQAAPGTALLCFQGPARFHAIVDAMGNFQLKGISDSKNSYHKIIIEGYKFEPETGEVVWAIDKPGTGKNAYRVKMRRPYMETDLILFSCKQTTIFNLLEPRTFAYMTKLQLIDGRREAPPMRYWYSRIDTRTSLIASIYLEPGTPMKLILSDTVLRKKLILINADPANPEGKGYVVDDWPFIYYTDFMVAKDMWHLLEPRIRNLENHGIIDDKIRGLKKEGMQALKMAETALEENEFGHLSEASARSWALASRVYDQVEKTQKDVLFGVLFYIALFVPFAFCAERLLFSYTNIYKRIIAFLTILIVLIAVIYQVHPAFQLAYSPMVVILAFFIIGLSLMVSLIIFLRFEDEMLRLQKSVQQSDGAEMSRWKAFVAAFFLGVSNLRRRRIRTFLTCTTLIILTFTIMSFTSVKSSRLHSRLQYQPESPYNGFLMKNVNWQSLPPEALNIISNSFTDTGLAVPRVWLESGDRTRAEIIPLRLGEKSAEAGGMVGLSANEPNVSGMDEILVGGRWFQEGERYALMIPLRMAQNLGIDPENPGKAEVELWGKPFKVVGTFSGEKLQERTDLDGEPLTPVIFPREAAAVELTEVELDAMESGEDILAFQSLYNHIPGELTIIIPYQTLLAFGGQLKAVAVRYPFKEEISNAATKLVDRFGLTLFSGEPDGIYIYNASDTLSYSGVPNILIPLIISIFIVLNTMIGSVYERKREIGIYTSVGLAPSHVSFLFVAESLAFAVLSVVLGYLLAQTSAGLFADTWLWSGITVNYSSLAGVAAMILVILVVLISVIYPSKVAADIAIPDVNRSWKLPEAKGNTLEVGFPFLMKYHEHRSIAGFIYNYFSAHKDVSHGIFSTGDISFGFVCPIPDRLTQEKEECRNKNQCTMDACMDIDTKVWLAPFDFGIKQQVQTRFCPSTEEIGYLEIKVVLVRESGESNAWRRINKGFLHAFRKQILLWRSLNDEEKKYYEQMLDHAQRQMGLITESREEKQLFKCDCRVKHA